MKQYFIEERKMKSGRREFRTGFTLGWLWGWIKSTVYLADYTVSFHANPYWKDEEAVFSDYHDARHNIECHRGYINDKTPVGVTRTKIN